MQAILKIYTKYLSKNGTISKDDRSLFYNYFMVPFSAGLAGFATFLFILITIDFGAYVLGISEVLNIGINEVLIATVGFVLKFVYEFMKSMRQKEGSERQSQ